MTISKTIIELRSEQGLSQKQLADAIGVSQSTIAKIEIDRNEATCSTLRKLASYFGVSSDYILGLEDDFGVKINGLQQNRMLNSEERELIRLFRSLNAPMQNVALETLRLWAGKLSGNDAPKMRDHDSPDE